MAYMIIFDAQSVMLIVERQRAFFFAIWRFILFDERLICLRSCFDALKQFVLIRVLMGRLAMFKDAISGIRLLLIFIVIMILITSVTAFFISIHVAPV
jgi:hypothetical protein